MLRGAATNHSDSIMEDEQANQKGSRRENQTWWHLSSSLSGGRTQTYSGFHSLTWKRKRENEAQAAGLVTNLVCSAHLLVAAGSGVEAAEAAAAPAAGAF